MSFLDVIHIFDDTYNIGDSEYGYYACNISFYSDFLDRYNITDEQKKRILEITRDAIAQAVQENEG